MGTTKRQLTLVAAAVLSLAGAAVPAMADPTDAPSQEQVDAARAAAEAKAGTVEGVQAKLDAANARLEAAELAASQAAEAANGAIWRLQEAEAAAKEAAAADRAARRALRGHKAAYTDLIARTYEQQPELHALSALTSKARPQQMVDSASTTYQLNTAMSDIESGYADAADAAEVASAKADDARAEAASLADQAVAARNHAQAAADGAAAEAERVAAEKSALITEIARLQNISVELAAQRQSALEDEERRAAAAAAEQRAEEAFVPSAPAADPAPVAPAPDAAPAPQPAPQPTRDPEPAPAPAPEPAPSGDVGDVIAFARAQLGDWYLWGAEGPDRWDCSGLTMMAWRQAGKYLPHYSVAQYDAGTPIAISSARAGDLLFWSSNGRPSGIHHVALYIGGGQYIHARRAGTQVSYGDFDYWYPDMAVRL